MFTFPAWIITKTGCKFLTFTNTFPSTAASGLALQSVVSPIWWKSTTVGGDKKSRKAANLIQAEGQQKSLNHWATLTNLN